jgi:hypothetical protein
MIFEMPCNAAFGLRTIAGLIGLQELRRAHPCAVFWSNDSSGDA